MACFQMLGMYPVARLWLHMVLYVSIMTGGRCLRWCEVMPENPGALGFIVLKESVMCLVVICGKSRSEKQLGSDCESGFVMSLCSDRYVFTCFMLSVSKR